MNALIQFAARRAAWVLIIILGISLLAAWQLPTLRVEVSAQSLLDDEDPAYQQYQQILATYGASDSIAVLIQDDALFNLENLQQLEAMQQAFSKLPYVEGVDSLFSIDNVKNIEGDIRFNPYLSPLPETQDAASRIKEDALHNPFIRNNLLAADGNTMAMNIRLVAKLDDVSERDIIRDIGAIITPVQDNFQRVFALGMPYVLTSLSDLILIDQQTILPLSLGVLLLVLFISLRRVSSMVLPFLTSVISVIWTLALMAVLDIPVNIMTSIVPALLVVVGSTEDVHLLSSWYRARQQGMSAMDAIAHMAEHTGLAILLTFITTYLGFLSIAMNDVELLRQFGLIASGGLLFNFIITTLLTPALLRWSRTTAKTAQIETPAEHDAYSRLAGWLFQLVSHNRLTTMTIASIIAVLAGIAAMEVRVDNNNMSYLSTDAPIHEQANTMHDTLAGMHTLDIVLTSPIEETFLKVRYLEALQDLQLWLDETGYFDKTLSFVDYVKLINNVMDEDLLPGELFLPEEDGQVREYMLFVDAEKTRPYIDDMFSQARIVVRHNISSSARIRDIMQEIEAHAAENIPPGLKLTITGDAVLSREAADHMIEGQITSLLFMLVVIIGIVAILFVDIRAGIVAAIPNIFPVIALFGVMGLFDIPLNTGTAMVAAIAIGICVDDTMHFLVAYNQQMRHHDSVSDGILAAMQHEARPIMSTSLALMLGFGVLALSAFPPVMHFGLLSAFAILLAVISNFILMPVLLSYVRLVTIWDVIGTQIQSQLTERCPLFVELKPFEIRKLIAVSKRLQYKNDEHIVKQGEKGNEMFVLLSGNVDVFIEDYNKKPIYVQSMGTGDIFGEVALMGDNIRTANIVANGDVEVLSLELKDLRRLSRFMSKTTSKLFLNLSSVLANRMANTMSTTAIKRKP